MRKVLCVAGGLELAVDEEMRRFEPLGVAEDF